MESTKILGPFQHEDRFSRQRISIIKIWRSLYSLIFIIGFSILIRRHLYVETPPGSALINLIFLFHYNTLKLWVKWLLFGAFYGKPFEHGSYFEHIKRIEMLKNIAQRGTVWISQYYSRSTNWNMQIYHWISNEPRYHMLQIKPAFKENTSWSEETVSLYHCVGIISLMLQTSATFIKYYSLMLCIM